jgi:hypothetical protein
MSKALTVLLELKDCSDYWSEYSVPIGIHERIDEAIQQLLAQPEHIVDVTDMVEPVAWMYEWYENDLESTQAYCGSEKPFKGESTQPFNFRPLYAAPSKQESLTPRQGLEEYKRGYVQAELDLKREPLIYEHLEDLVDKYYGYPMTLGRAIEKAHGITGGGE